MTEARDLKPAHTDRLKIATFNVWHGLAGRGVLRFREFETRERREDRFTETLRVLSDLEPDILLLQELNPVTQRGLELRRVLGGAFSGRVDQSGLKIFSHGLPFNLATGLGILVRGSVRPAREREDKFQMPSFVRLSGGAGFSGETMSAHFEEQRYAQFKSVWHEKYGRLLIVNTHLHHGFERFKPLIGLLETSLQAGKISQVNFDQLLVYLDRAQVRRLHEVDHLLEIVHRAASAHDGVLLGGDLNSTSDGAAFRALMLDGFKDLSSDSEPTWDPLLNVENHRIQAEVGFDFPLPNFGYPEFLRIYRAFDALPRRIDFLLAKGSIVRPSAVTRFGFVNSVTGLAPSDHFGVIASFEGKL